LAKFFQPSAVKRIFEDKTKLQYRHSDNINFFFQAVKNEGLPEVFHFELTDLYDKKNIPKVIYCIHALSHLLAKKGKAPHIKNLLGRLEFTDEVLDATTQGLADAGVSMPSFGNIQNELAKELNEETEEERQARLERERLEEMERYFMEHHGKLVKVQAQIRMKLQKDQFEQQKDSAVKIQAIWKGSQQRRKYQEKMQSFKSNEKLFERVQAIYRGKKVREQYEQQRQFYKQHESEIIRMQAWWRGVHARQQYQNLRLKKGKADIKVVQQYIHLLDTQDDEFDEERLVEELRGTVIQKIRENLSSEHDLNELDAKVALLIKNRISIEEVAHLKSKDMRAQLARSAQTLAQDGGILSFRGSDKDTKERRKRYEELFYVLQTQPKYLAHLMFTINKTSGASATKFLEQVVLTLYGYAQNAREEYLFLQLIEDCIRIEVNELNNADEMVRENPLFIKLALQYTRGAKEREFLRNLFCPLLEAVMSDSSLELETDPLSIYKNLIRQEELNTGEKSAKPYDVTMEVAQQDPDVKRIQLENLSKLQKITDSFLSAIIKCVDRMPYGIRYIAMKMRENMKLKFPNQEKEISLMIGNLLYYRYMNPVIIAPEAFDVIETAVSPVQRKNLAEVAKMLHQISVAKQNTEQPLTEPGFATEQFKYVQQASAKFSYFLKEASNVITAEEFFDINEFLDIGKTAKVQVYITPDEIVQVHNALVQYLDQLPSTPNDPLRTILDEFGQPPTLGSAAKGPGSEIVLHLSNRFAKADKDAPLRRLMKETKRMILLIIRFSSGKSLLDILEEQATEIQETNFAKYVREQESIRATNLSSPQLSSPDRDQAIQSSGNDLNSPGTSPVYKTMDDSIITFAQLKIKALESMAKLEKMEKVSKADKYQSMLDSIVEDMLNKQRRRQQRRREIQQLRKTMQTLDDKSAFLQDSMKSYHDYIESCMAQLNKKGYLKIT
jgi:hypothetical protein